MGVNIDMCVQKLYDLYRNYTWSTKIVNCPLVIGRLNNETLHSSFINHFLS